MRLFRDARRAVLLTLSLLSACAAADPTASTSRTPATVGSSGDYLAGRFALAHGDFDAAAGDLLRALDANPGYRPIVALHAGMIADLAGRQDDAGLYYQQAEPEKGDQNPRSAIILASWYARSGQLAAAEGILARMAANVPEAGIAMPGLIA